MRAIQIKLVFTAIKDHWDIILILPVEINCHVTGKKKGAEITAPFKVKSLASNQ
jgi:hypothetical protein